MAKISIETLDLDRPVGNARFVALMEYKGPPSCY